MTETHKPLGHFHCLVFDIRNYIFVSGRTFILFSVIYFLIAGSDFEKMLLTNIYFYFILQITITLVTYLHYGECQTYDPLSYGVQIFHIQY